MNVNFYLDKRPDRKGKHPIFLYIRFSGQTMKIYTRKKIDLADWDKVKQRPKKRNDQKLKELSRYLKSLESEIDALDSKVLTARKQMTVEYLKKNLSLTRKHDGSFFAVWEEYTNSNEVKPGTRKAYNTALKNLKVIDGSHPGLTDVDYPRYKSMEREREYIKQYDEYKIEFASINRDFVKRLQDYSIFMGFKNEFCHQLLTRVKAFMNWSVENEYIKDVEFRELKTKLEKLDSDANIYFLHKDELGYLASMNIQDERLEKVRDVFCFYCYTGSMRYGDVQKLKKTDIKGNKYEILSEKTGKPVRNPLFDPALDILKKYEDIPGPYALPAISNAKMNVYLKELARQAGLDRKVTLYGLSGTENAEARTFPLYSIISTHTARKTFISYLINTGMDKNLVRKWTGQSEDVITRYYDIVEDYEAKQTEKLNKQFKEDARNGKKLRKA